MALQYTLKIATELEPQNFLARMFNNIGIKTDVKPADRPGVFLVDSVPGFVAYTSYLDEEERSFLNEELGISPTIHVLFRLDKFMDRVVARSIIVKMTVEFLKNASDDVVLLFNGEEVLLLRSKGELFINRLMDFWDSHLDLVTLPYEMKEFSVL
jgi:hypothetical protein